MQRPFAGIVGIKGDRYLSHVRRNENCVGHCTREPPSVHRDHLEVVPMQVLGCDMVV